MSKLIKSQIKREGRREIRPILLILGANYNEVYGPVDFRCGQPKDRKPFSWNKFMGSEVKDWIQKLWRKQMTMHPDEDRIKALNQAREDGFKICEYH